MKNDLERAGTVSIYREGDDALDFLTIMRDKPAGPGKLRPIKRAVAVPTKSGLCRRTPKDSLAAFEAVIDFLQRLR